MRISPLATFLVFLVLFGQSQCQKISFYERDQKGSGRISDKNPFETLFYKTSKNFVQANLYRESNYTEEDKSTTHFARHLIASFNTTFRSALDFLIYDPEIDSYEMPFREPFPGKDVNFDEFSSAFHTHSPPENVREMEFFEKLGTNKEDPLYTVNLRKFPFEFEVKRNDNQEVIMSTVGTELFFSKFHTTFCMARSGTVYYGMGERNYKFLLEDGVYTVWARDKNSELEDGKPPGHQTYGVHSVFLSKDRKGKFFMVYLRNPEGFDFFLKPDKICYQKMSGPFNFKIFLCDEYPEACIINYHRYIGAYSIPPFWSLGAHHSKFGLKSFLDMEEILLSYQSLNIPLEGLNDSSFLCFMA